jgi:hypothetical protein
MGETFCVLVRSSDYDPHSEVEPFASTQTLHASLRSLPNRETGITRRRFMKWAGMYFVGFVILIGGVLAALWKLGVLQNIETTWILIGVAILIGLGIMISVSNSGTKENIQIDRK